MDSFFKSETDFLNVYIIPWSINIIMALVVFIIGRWLAKQISRLTRKLMVRAELDEILVNFVGNIIEES